MHIGYKLPLVILNIISFTGLQEKIGGRVIATENINKAFEVEHAVFLSVFMHRVS